MSNTESITSLNPELQGLLLAAVHIRKAAPSQCQDILGDLDAVAKAIAFAAPLNPETPIAVRKIAEARDAYLRANANRIPYTPAVAAQ